MKNILHTTLLILFAATIFAQTDTAKVADAPPVKFKLKKNIKAADRMMSKGNLYSATDLYEEILTHAPENSAIAFKLAESFHIARDYRKAEEWYRKVAESDPVTFPQARYWQALMMKMNAKFEEAKKVFDDFAKSYKGEDTRLKKWAETESKGCDLALKMKGDPLPLNVIHLSNNVNSPYSDLAPLMWDDTTFLFASLPSDTVIVVEGDRSLSDHFIKFYYSIVKNRYEFSPSQPFALFNLPGAHTANGAFSPDRKRFYFTQCIEQRKGEIICAIMVSEREKEGWSEPVSVSAQINLPAYTSTHPSVAPAKKGMETLLFTSNRPDGKGGLDIWYSTYNINKKTYSPPKNAGAKINTDRDEATPYYDVVENVLYFSSNGHVNIGGYDIYRATGSPLRWDEPVNIGYPVNSSADDMYFRLADDGKRGFFVSNRPGIVSIRSETCCDDIFAFEYIKIVNLAVKGTVFDEDNVWKAPVENAKVTLSLESGEGILQNIPLGEDFSSSAKPYFFSLNADKKYRVTGSADGYLSNSAVFTTKGIDGSDTLTVDLYLNRLILDKTYRLRNIYYDFDKWDLRDESMQQLDTLYDLMIENPTIIVEIGSHTDSRSSEQYNLTLSQKRAESCVNYLIGKGIQKERLKAKGYGKSRLLDDCSQYADCPSDNTGDCPCHQNNRRTEFKVVGEDLDLIYDDLRYGDDEGEKKKKR